MDKLPEDLSQLPDFYEEDHYLVPESGEVEIRGGKVVKGLKPGSTLNVPRIKNLVCSADDPIYFEVAGYRYQVAKTEDGSYCKIPAPV